MKIILHNFIGFALAASIFACFACLFTGCAFLESPRGQSLVATGKNILGAVAVAELKALASGEGDYAHAAATAAWGSVSVTDLFSAIRASGASPALAARAADVAVAARSVGHSERAVLNAVASGLSPVTR